MPRTVTRDRNRSPYVNYGFDQDNEPRSPFGGMFRVATILVALIFLVTVGVMIWFFVSGQSVSYSYDYQFGGVSYHESYNLDR